MRPSRGPRRSSAAGYQADAPMRSLRSSSVDDASAVEANEPSPSGGWGGLRDRLARLTRSSRKAKADRAFDRRYGGDDIPSSSADEGPRAALYKGEMGANHRRAARMQDNRARTSRGASSKRAPQRSSRLIVTCAVTACLLLTALFLYAPAQQYYQELRERDRLQVEYTILQQRNDAIQQEIDRLSTDEGVEDRARAEYGWVKEGENAVNVSGVASADPTYNVNVLSTNVKPPETWYSPILDPLFGVNS